MSELKKVSFIGVGNMGNPMASQLLKKGFDVTVFDARESTMHAFVREHGGESAATLADGTRGARRGRLDGRPGRRRDIS